MTKTAFTFTRRLHHLLLINFNNLSVLGEGEGKNIILIGI